MRQRLNAGHQLHTHALRIGIDLAQLILCVAAAQITEIWILRHFVGVLGIQHQEIHAQRGQLVDIALDRPHRHHRAAGHIHHRAHGMEMTFLLHVQGQGVLLHRTSRQKEAAAQSTQVLSGNAAALRRHADTQSARDIRPGDTNHALYGAFTFIQAEALIPRRSACRAHAPVPDRSSDAAHGR